MFFDGASVNGPPNTNIDETPFGYALRSQNPNMIRWMLSHPDLDPNVIVEVDGEPNGLSYAIEQSMAYDIIVSMVQHGALLSYNDELGNWYPLSMAVHVNDRQVIQLLLFYGANPQYEDDDEQVPADYATDDLVRNALANWSYQTTLTLRQMVGNDPARLLENPVLWLEAIDAELNQGMANLIMT
jgi:ankyrin repeat protein